VEARGAIFWTPLLLAIGLAESWRVALGWATPVGNGFNRFVWGAGCCGSLELSVTILAVSTADVSCSNNHILIGAAWQLPATRTRASPATHHCIQQRSQTPAPLHLTHCSLKDDYEMGNLLFDPLNLRPQDPEEDKIMQTKELNNGRLAMIAIAAFTAQVSQMYARAC
jgi:hypothetical protein